jgi:DnaJ-class molecular chaperone
VPAAAPGVAVLQLLILALIAAVCYRISLKFWPWTYCRRCEGGGRNAGSTRKRFGTCRACGGSGRKKRLGARMIERHRGGQP